MKFALFALLTIFGFGLGGLALFQQSSIPININPSPQVFGTGSASTRYTCGQPLLGLLYIQIDPVLPTGTGRLNVCMQDGSSAYFWNNLSLPLASATSGTITGGSFLLGGCTATATVTIPGATVGTNSATATPIYVTAPTGNQGLFNLTAWVSATNTVTVQGCALGVLSSVPNFQAKVLLY